MADEYLEGIMNREPRAGLILPKREWQASFHGMSVYLDESIPRGTFEIRDEDSKILGRIYSGQNVTIGVSRS